MKSNKKIREELERLYGRGCMFKKAGIEQKIKDKKIIKTYKKFLQEQRYTGKKIRRYEKMMTLHHLKHCSEGGETSLENGAVINWLAHMYIHSLPREQEEYVNNELRKFKAQIEIDKGLVVKSNYAVLEEDVELLEDYSDLLDTKPERPKQKYNRAKSKRELQQQIDAILYDEVEEDFEYYRKEVDDNMLKKLSSKELMLRKVRNTVKGHAQSILRDETISSEEKKADFVTIEEFTHYVDNYDINQQKLADYDKMKAEYDHWQQVMLDDGR